MPCIPNPQNSNPGNPGYMKNQNKIKAKCSEFAKFGTFEDADC